jgi:hypothetical protein
MLICTHIVNLVSSVKVCQPAFWAGIGFRFNSPELTLALTISQRRQRRHGRESCGEMRGQIGKISLSQAV